MALEFIAIGGIGEIGVAADLAGIIFDAANADGTPLQDGDILIVNHFTSEGGPLRAVEFLINPLSKTVRLIVSGPGMAPGLVGTLLI